jgi:hypothetical protein
MSGAVERSGNLGQAKDLAEGAGQNTALSGNENFPARPHHFGPDYMLGEVYFVTDGELIKIGYSGSAKVRMKALKSAAGKDLKLLKVVPGTRDDESRFHKLFQHLRVQGEWFRRDPELLGFIEGRPDPDDADLVQPTVVCELQQQRQAMAALSKSEGWPPQVMCYFHSIDAMLGRLILNPKDAQWRQALPMALAGLEGNIKWWRSNPPPLLTGRG